MAGNETMTRQATDKSAGRGIPVEPVRVAVAGSVGRMGREVVKTVITEPDLLLVGAVDNHQLGIDAALAAGLALPCNVAVQDDLKTMLAEKRPQVVVDFTHPGVVFQNAMTIIEAGCRPIIGTTGLMPEHLEQLDEALRARRIGGMVVPNFAIGAVLMMKFAQEASKYFPHAEIIELHHNQKADAPSGTALKTAEKMAEGLREGGHKKFGASNAYEKEVLPGSRGGEDTHGIHIHSVRLPGLVAHQEVIFGGQGEILSIRHDSLDRTSFMPGVALAINKVLHLDGLVYGLEHIL